MTDNELLLAISDMMDKKLDARLQPIENDIKSVYTDLEQIVKTGKVDNPYRYLGLRKEAK